VESPIRIRKNKMPNPIKVVKGLARMVGGISGKGAKNVDPVYRETGNSVKVIKPGTKPLTKPIVPYHSNAPRSQSDLKRMGL
jgi:hypothetical protein